MLSSLPLRLVLSAVLVGYVAGDGIIDKVQCEKTTMKYTFANTTLSNDVCKPGSVSVDNWLTKAIRTQEDVARNTSICDSTFIGTHNSIISQASGFGTWDDLLTSTVTKFLKDPDLSKLLAAKFNFSTSGLSPQDYTVKTANQALSVRDQIRMGARFLELDLHNVQGTVIQAHCGGFSKTILSTLQSQIGSYFPLVVNLIKSFSPEAADIIGNYVSQLLDSGNTPYLVGCIPGMSGLPTEKQPTAQVLFDDILAFLKEPGNDKFVLHLYIDTDSHADSVTPILKMIKSTFGDMAFTPSDFAAKYASDWTAVTSESLLASGKRVFFTSSADVASIDPTGTSYCFTSSVSKSSAGVAFCGGWHEFTEADAIAPYPSCSLTKDGQNFVANTNFQSTGLVRFYTSDLQYGPLDESFSGIRGPRPPKTTLIQNVRDCFNIITWDDMSPSSASLAIWTWAQNEPAILSGKDTPVCACLSSTDAGRWKACPCTDATVPLACRNTATNEWTFSASSCPTGSLFAAPRTPHENQMIFASMGSSAATKVRLNYQTLPYSPGSQSSTKAGNQNGNSPDSNGVASSSAVNSASLQHSPYLVGTFVVCLYYFLSAE